MRDTQSGSMLMLRLCGSAFFLLILSSSFAQPDTLLKHITLSEVVITAQTEGFSVERFVEQVKEDTTFYKAFLNMKFHPHIVESELRVKNKREVETASLLREGRLARDIDKAELIIDSEKETGKLRERDGDMRYLTAEMYDEVFWPKGSYIADNRIKSREQELVKGGKIDEYKSELKKFMFNPGQEIGSVPFIGNKMALFDPHMVPFYNYSIWSSNRNGLECWVFSAEAKPEERGNRTVIKSMDTWFDKESMQVMARDYRIAHNTIILDFDISIQVMNTTVNGVLVPSRITYDGQFDLPLKKPEIVKFWLKMSNWEVR